MTFQNSGGYAGDLLATDAYGALATDPTAILIDVRTQAEWAYVGVPDLAGLGKTPFLIEWQSYPSGHTDPQFAPRLAAALGGPAKMQDSGPLYFLCRSGHRSRLAAIALTSAGWSRCFNISDGFEGVLDAQRHRGGVNGWKASGLPWRQS